MQNPSNNYPVSIEEEMKGSYLSYAMSVIIGRALPEIRDGFKPVHRRILYAMFREGLLSNKRFSKCAGVVGEVLKKYHPHGDSAVYDALVRLAQEWNLRYPLINGQGNFGSVDGDSAAAYRYTEAKMTKLAEYMLADIDKDTVDWTTNFDDTTKEPMVLPTRIPNMLLNGASGIAVGMATNIPPHNLTEVVDGCLLMIEKPDTTIEELMEIIPGPDFPTGGFIYGCEGIKKAYFTGNGSIVMRARALVEKDKRTSRESIIISEIPYQVNKARLIEKIAHLVRDKKITDISDIRDESDRDGMRIVIELKRDTYAIVVLNQLYKHTSLQSTFGANLVSIVGSEPKRLNIKKMLCLFVDHRRDVVLRRSRFELQKAKDRMHIIEGLIIALDNIDEIIRLIRASKNANEAREALMANFKLSQVQAQAILDMRLHRLTSLERDKILHEFNELKLEVEKLEEILSSETALFNVIKAELNEVKDKFGDERRTEIIAETKEISLEDTIVEEDMVVTISHKGYIKRNAVSLYRAQKRGGKGRKGAAHKEEDFVVDLFVASTHSYLLIFTRFGKCFSLKVHEIPQGGFAARGKAIVNIINLEQGDGVAAVLPIREFKEDRYILMVTNLGVVKKTDLMAFSNIRINGIIAINLDEGDDLIAARQTDGNQEVFVATVNGMAIRFKETDVRPMGRATRGVKGIVFSGNDHVIGMEVLSHSATILTVCENGFGKRSKIEEYRITRRGGKGVITIKTSERNGKVVGILQVTDEEHIILITKHGMLIRMNVSDIKVIGRNTQGVTLISMADGELVVGVAKFVVEREDERDIEREDEGDDDYEGEEE